MLPSSRQRPTDHAVAAAGSPFRETRAGHLRAGVVPRVDVPAPWTSRRSAGAAELGAVPPPLPQTPCAGSRSGSRQCCPWQRRGRTAGRHPRPRPCPCTRPGAWPGISQPARSGRSGRWRCRSRGGRLGPWTQRLGLETSPPAGVAIIARSSRRSGSGSSGAVRSGGAWALARSSPPMQMRSGSGA